jgi:hypothetical protein
LASTIDNVQDKVDISTMPDPSEDPVGYADAREEKLLRKIEKIMSNSAQPKRSTNGYNQYQQQTRDVNLTQEQRVQEIALATIHSDYYDVLDEVKQDINRDPVLRNQIMGSQNPAKEAYDYGKKKRNSIMETKNKQYEQAFAESGSQPPPAEREQPLTAADKIILRKLNMTPEEYTEHKNKMKRGGRL